MPGLVESVRTEVAHLDVSRRALVRFGVAVGGVFLLLVAVSAWRGDGEIGRVAQMVGAAGAALVLFGLALPRALGPVYRLWMTGALVMGFVMTRVILTLAFVLVFVPVGLVFRLVRRDVLAQRPDPEARTYWLRRDDGPSGKERLERMY